MANPTDVLGRERSDVLVKYEMGRRVDLKGTEVLSGNM